MGLFKKIISAFAGDQEEETGSVEITAEVESSTNLESSAFDDEGETGGFEFDRTTVEYDGGRFNCQYSDSPNCSWRVAYGRDLQSGEHRTFLLQNDEIRFTESMQKVGTLGGKAAVADNGVAAVLDDLDSDELSGKLAVFDSSGNEQLTHVFESNVETCAVTADGQYAAAATLNPDCSTYIFDLAQGEQVLKHKNQEGNMMGLEFRGNGEYGLSLRLYEDTGLENPVYEIDVTGDVVWRSEELERKERIESLIESSDTSDLEEAIQELKEAYELAEDENEEKRVAEKLGDTHWKLAKQIDRGEEDSDECWQHLNQAKTYYMEILPWYDGKQGVAKVSRKQGKYYLDQGDEEAALEMFQSIADLEEEYDVQLLTEADKKRIEKLTN